MFGCGFSSISTPLCSQSMMCSYNMPVTVPTPVYVPVPINRPCAVPVPVPVPVPVATSMPICQKYQCQPTEVCYKSPSCCRVEYVIEEPICIKRRRRRRRRSRSYSRSRAPLPPIIIPIPMQAPAVAPQQQPPQQPPLQVIQYVQDIYLPPQVFTEQVPIGYTTKNTTIQQPGLIQNQGTLINCQPGIILPSASSSQAQPYIVQKLPSGQLVQRQLSVGGGSGVQTVFL
ncbi:unnamed protein product [Rotaria sordida]|uniref:Uncharacterized protein n=1 Tax=Rotaria sordida TaxID=392033 RepID=A0A815P1V0_9BILA|nr:unnamed protein product [Rotaria sordida]CAF1442719.1 unnamed protein product [Rotaria sordida]